MLKDAHRPAEDGHLDAPPAVLQRLCNELKKATQVLPRRTRYVGRLRRCATPATRRSSTTWPTLIELHEAERSGEIYTHHFNMLRRSWRRRPASSARRLRLSASSAMSDDSDRRLHKRMIEPDEPRRLLALRAREMMDENKELFPKDSYDSSSTRYPFNPELVRRARTEVSEHT